MTPHRQRPGRPSRDDGQATVEHIGVLVLVALVIGAAVLAFTAAAPGVRGGAAELVCRVLTVGQGACGGAPGTPLNAEPDLPCPVSSQGDTVEAGLGITFVALGGDRGLLVETRSDGTYQVRQTTGGEVGATAGVGASVGLTVADVELGGGATASVEGGVRFQGGQEWSGLSREEMEEIRSAENWERVEQATPGVGPAFGAVRDALGLGPRFPPPDRVFVEGGLYGEGSAYAGAGAVGADASVGAAQLLGYSYSPAAEDEHTFYYRSSLEGDAAATALGLAGAGLSGSAETLVSVTVRDGDVVEVSRTGIAQGEASGLTAALFGEPLSASTNDSASGGAQYTATLVVDDEADRRAALALLASSGVDAATAGLTTTVDPDDPLDPLSAAFMDRVKEDGELTRVAVEETTSVPFALDVGVEMGPVAGLNGGYSTADTAYSSPEYHNGVAFVPRTNC